MSDTSNLSDNQLHWLTYLNIASSSVSMLCSGFIVLSMIFLAIKSKRDRDDGSLGILKHLHFRLVFLVSSSDILYSTAMLLGDPADGSDLCYAQSFIMAFSALTSIGFVFCIAVSLWGSFVLLWPNDPAFEHALLTKYIAAVLSGAAVLTCLPFADGNHFGTSGPWCWIDDTDTGQVFRFISFYMWLWLAIVLILVMYSQLLNRLYQLMHKDGEHHGGVCSMLKVVICGAKAAEKDNVHTTEMIRVMRKVALYPIILIGCWVFGTANRIHETINRDNPSMGLTVMHLVTSNMNGLLNALVYGFNESLYNQLARHCCGRKSMEDLGENAVEMPMDEMNAIRVDDTTGVKVDQ